MGIIIDNKDTVVFIPMKRKRNLEEEKKQIVINPFTGFVIAKSAAVAFSQLSLLIAVSVGITLRALSLSHQPLDSIGERETCRTYVQLLFLLT